MAKRQSAYSLILKEQQDAAKQGQLDSQPVEQQNPQPSKQEDIQTDSHSAVQTAKPLDSKTEKRQRIKATFYLTSDDIIAIDEMQTKRFRETGKKPEKSKLVSEAIQMLKQQNS